MREKRGLALIGVSGVFATAASLVPVLILRLFFTFLSVACLVISIEDLGGIPCKEQISGAFRFCLRCFGFYIGFAVSIGIVTFLNLGSYPIPIFSALGVALLFAFALDIPTMYHGFRRRQYGEPARGWVLVLCGFLVGLSALAVFLAVNSLVLLRSTMPQH